MGPPKLQAEPSPCPQRLGNHESCADVKKVLRTATHGDHSLSDRKLEVQTEVSRVKVNIR